MSEQPGSWEEIGRHKDKRIVALEAELKEAQERIYVLEETLGSEDDAESWISLKRKVGQYREAARKCLNQWGQGRTEWTVEEQALRDLLALSETPPPEPDYNVVMRAKAMNPDIDTGGSV